MQSARQQNLLFSQHSWEYKEWCAMRNAFISSFLTARYDERSVQCIPASNILNTLIIS